MKKGREGGRAREREDVPSDVDNTVRVGIFRNCDNEERKDGERREWRTGLGNDSLATTESTRDGGSSSLNHTNVSDENRDELGYGKRASMTR